MEKVRNMIRYSRHEGKYNRKNTLFTVRVGEKVFFGISRCNLRAGDRFNKKQGTLVAQGRAALARAEEAPAQMSVNLHDSGLRGWCYMHDLPVLFDFFNNVDDYFLKVSGLQYISETYTADGDSVFSAAPPSNWGFSTVTLQNSVVEYNDK
jgi:hypothetical protein